MYLFVVFSVFLVYAGYEVIIMPGEGGGIKEAPQSPRAGLKGGGNQKTKEEIEKEKADKLKTEEAAKRAEKDWKMGVVHPKKEFLDEITSEQYKQIKAFEIKAQEKPIETWKFEDVKNQFVDILKLYDELVKDEADIEAQNRVKDIATYCFGEYVKRPEAIEFEIPGEIRDRIREMEIASDLLPPQIKEATSVSESTVATDVLKAVRGKKVSPEQARILWKEYYKEQGKDFASLPWEERQALEMAIRQGIAPDLDIEPELKEFDTSIFHEQGQEDSLSLRSKGRKVTPEESRAQWTEFYKERGKDITKLPIEVKQALELAIAQGIQAEDHREPGKVLENASVDDDERYFRAQQLLELREPLSEKQKAALMKAHNVGSGRGVYTFEGDEITEKARFLAEAFNPEQRRFLMESGLAGVAVPVRAFTEEFNPDDYAGTPLQDIARELNTIGIAGLASESRLEDIASRVAATPGAPAALRDALLGQIRNFETARAAAEEAEQIARETGRRRRSGEEEREGGPLLGPGEARDEGFSAATYSAIPELAGIAQEVENALARGDEVNNEYLRQKIIALGPILPGLTGRAEEFGYRLRRELDRLKQRLLANVATQAQRDRNSLYAEIRLKESDKIRILEYALKSSVEPDSTAEQKEAWRLLEEEFNIRFAKADVNSSDDWRDALGPGGSTEISEFIATLTNAAQNRTNLKGTLLTPDEQENVWRAVRRLKQEEKVREYLHTISYMVNSNAGAEDIIKAATRFPGEELHVVFARPGVAQMLRLYEQAMLEVTVKNGGYLPAKAMITTSDGRYGEVEQRVWEQAKLARDMGVLPKGMPDWELRRAIALARGAGIITGRFFEIAAANGLNKNVPLNSFWANGLVKNFAFFEQTMRFNVGQAQNAILGYKLEGGGGPWSTDELEKFKKMGTKELFDTVVNDRDDERMAQMKNPFHIGSIFTQTGWRWAPDKVTLASATAKLMQYEDKKNGFDGLNPLMGVGLMIERRRGALADHDDKKAQQEAHEAIHHALDLASEITPLKLFNNIIKLRQDVLREYYGKGKDGKRKDADVPRDTENSLYVEEDRKNSPGQILIKSKELQDDISALALVQEELLGRRVKAYKEYLDKMKIYEEKVLKGIKKEIVDGREQDVKPPPKPHLHGTGELNELKFECLVTSSDRTEREKQEAQARRVKLLAERITGEYKKGKHGDKLMTNLHDKGWKVPWIFGAEDIAHEVFDYEADTGDTIKRRWDADIGPVVQTAGLYGKFITNLSEFKSQHDIVKAMKEIHSTLSSHDASVANEAVRYLAEGVGKFYKKDWTTRLPFGVGKLEGFVGGKASYAQVAFGRGQMAWDELDMQAFIHHLHASGLMDHHQIEELKVRLGAENYQLAWAMLRSGIPMLLFGFIYMMLLEQVEQAKKAA